MLGFATASTTGKAKRVRRVSDIYGREFFRHRMMPVPANPYFLTKINIKRRRELVRIIMSLYIANINTLVYAVELLFLSFCDGSISPRK